MSTSVMKQDNKVWEKKKSLHLTYIWELREMPQKQLSGISIGHLQVLQPPWRVS